MIKEVWRPIKINHREYEVSNFGRIRNNGIIRKQSVSSSGYQYIGVTFNGIQKNYLIHRLVAEAFLPNPLKKPQVNHIDGDKSNNNVRNLEWVTASENMIHKANILKSPTSDRFLIQEVVCVETGERFSSISEAARRYNVSQPQISSVVHGYKYRHTAAGLHWELV